MPWAFKRFEETPVPEKDKFVVPWKSGPGLKFDEATIRRYGV